MLDHRVDIHSYRHFRGIFSRLHKDMRISRLGDLFRYFPPPFFFWQNHANIGIQKYFVTFLGNVSQEEIATQPLS